MLVNMTVEYMHCDVCDVRAVKKQQHVGASPRRNED